MVLVGMATTTSRSGSRKKYFRKAPRPLLARVAGRRREGCTRRDRFWRFGLPFVARRPVAKC